ncbi:MAG: hypothetical protein QOI29_1724, partial [Mycobacterium sp.]|nr:hypothetical protein [Mycobacterium sp.]
MSVRPYVTAGIVIAGATVVLANPPSPAEPSTVQRVVNPLVAQVASDPAPAIPSTDPVAPAGPVGSPAVAPWLLDVVIGHGPGGGPAADSPTESVFVSSVTTRS